MTHAFAGEVLGNQELEVLELLDLLLRLWVGGVLTLLFLLLLQEMALLLLQQQYSLQEQADTEDYSGNSQQTVTNCNVILIRVSQQMGPAIKGQSNH